MLETEAICEEMTASDLMGDGQAVCATRVQRVSKMRGWLKQLSELSEMKRQSSEIMALHQFQYRHPVQGWKEEGSVFEQCRLGAEYALG